MNVKGSGVPPPHRCLSQAFDGENSGAGGAWNHPLTRRRFLKRTGGATAATFIGWHLNTIEAQADDPPKSYTGASFNAYRMRLFAIDPAEGWAADINDEAATIDGNAEQIGVAIEILSSGDFQPLMLSSDVLYSVTAYATIIHNDVMTAVKTHTLELRGNCYLLSEWGPELASSVDEDPPTLLPPLLDKDFTFNQGGSTYRLAITQLDMTQFFKPDGSPDGNQTFVAAAAEITGPGVALSCETAKVTHTFESFPLL